MNRKLLVTLLYKNIEELNVITEGFMEMDEYPAAIIHLARRKTEDIEIIIDQLASEKVDQLSNKMPYINVHQEIESKYIAPTKHTEAEIVDVPEIIPQEKTALEESEIVSLPEEVEILESEIITPALENLEENLNPELILENTEIIVPAPEVLWEESTPELLVEEVEVEESPELVVEDEIAVEPEVYPEVYVEEEAELKILKDDRAIKTTVITTIDEIESKSTTEEHKRTIIAERIIQPTVSRNETLAKGDNSLSASIANKKITDIKQAISIGDRFRFQRELFKGNGEEMNRTLNYINQLATFDEASSFLMSKYGWDKANENVNDFLQLVRRRF